MRVLKGGSVEDGDLRPSFIVPWDSESLFGASYRFPEGLQLDKDLIPARRHIELDWW
jgi:hypothetical protein